MRILIMSDSHSGLQFMRYAIERTKPDTLVHLGDYYDDGGVIAEENSQLPMYRVCGNCDYYRCSPFTDKILNCHVGGVRLYMTHGHVQNVKCGTSVLLRDAREAGAAAVLYGHTHIAECNQEPDGLWVINPGSCRSFGGSVALMEIEKEKIKSCRILKQDDLEEFA